MCLTAACKLPPRPPTAPTPPPHTHPHVCPALNQAKAEKYKRGEGNDVKAVKDKKDCMKKLIKASEAFKNYKGKDEHLPKKW